MADGTTTTAAVAPVSAPVDLRPLTTSELIDRGFTLYRAHFAGFLLLALLCQSAPLLGQLLVTSLKLYPSHVELLETPAIFLHKLGYMFLITSVAQLIVFGFEVVLTFYIADAYLGKIPSISQSLRRLTSCIPSSLWTCILNRFFILLTLIFPVLAASAIYAYWFYDAPLTLAGIMLFLAGALLLLIVSLAPLLIVFMRLMATVPALALEEKSGWQAIKRSATLVRFDPGLGFLYWGEMRLSFLLLPLFIIELMILMLTSLPLTVHQAGEIMRHGASGQIAPPPDSVLILSQIMTFLAGSLILPLYSIATTLFYYDIRIRREGFDLEFMSSKLGARE